jgi:peptide/nickel transport system substrate-binding protein
VVGQEDKKLTASTPRGARALAVVALLAGLVPAACGRSQQSASEAPRPVRGLVASIRTEPRSFNRYAARDALTATLTHLLHATLVRIDRRTQELEPWLAESWSVSPDGLTYTL